MNTLASLSSIRKLAPLVIVLVSATLAVVAYLQALHYPFVSDDSLYISENTKLLGLHFTELWRLFIEPYNRFSEFLPLRELSYWFDITLFGLNPAAFRVHNIILYLLCLPLVYATTSGLWRYFRPADAASAPWAAAAVTALFVLHPSHAEAVVWISGRKDVLSTLFSLLAIWFAINAKRKHGFSTRYAVATLTALLAALLSKASSFAVSPVIAMLWVMFWLDIPTPNRHRSLLLWPLGSLLLAACVALIFATIITTRTPFYFGVEAVTRSLAVLGWLARLAVSPESRHFFYPVLEDPYLPLMVILGVTVLLAAVVACVVAMRRKRSSLEGFSIIVFFLLCIPSIQLIPYSLPSLVSDRWLALAVWPVVMLLVASAWRLKPAPRLVLLLVIALSWSFQNMERPRDWRNFEVLVDADIRAFPGYDLLIAYKIIFNQLPQKRYREAEETAAGISEQEFRRVMIRLIEADHATRVTALDTGSPQEAISLLWQLEKDIKLPAQAKWNSAISDLWMFIGVVFRNEWEFLAKKFPEDESVHYNAGLWFLKIGKYEDAAVQLRIATDSGRLLESARGTAFKNYGIALLNGGHVAEAEMPLHAALQQTPPDLQANCVLAEVYKRMARPEDAARFRAGCDNWVSSKGAAQ